MSSAKKNLNRLLLSKFSGDSNSINIPKPYFLLTKCLNKARFLNQIIYYSGISTYFDDGQFYKSYKDWVEELLLCERTIRSYAKEFENNGWIAMRTIKIHGTRTPVYKPDFDKIFNDILALDAHTHSQNKEQVAQDLPQTATSAKLYNNCPKRQNLPDSQTAKFAVSNTIYTNNYDQLKTTNCKPSSSSFVFSVSKDPEFLALRLSRDSRDDEHFLADVKEHIEHHSDEKFTHTQRIQGALKLLKKLKEQNVIFCVAGKAQADDVSTAPKVTIVQEEVYSEEEKDLLGDLKAGIKLGKPEMFFTGKPERFARAQGVLRKEQELMESWKKKENLPKGNVRRNSLTSLSSLVSHLPLSRHAS